MVRWAGRGIIFLVLVSLTSSTTRGQGKVKDTEQRDFSIFVDGKEAGQSRMTITVLEDDTTVMTASASVNIRKLIFNYSFSIESAEWWKDGKLVRMKNSATEDGKHTDVEVRPDGQQLKLKVNGQEKPLSPEIWVSSYWKLADAKYHNKKMPLLDSDTGKEMTGELKYVGTEQININSQPQNCYHFRITGIDVPIELWFDRYHRLVRQEFTESGHKTIVQLNNIKR